MEKWAIGKHLSAGRFTRAGGGFFQDEETKDEEESVADSRLEVKSIVGVFNPCCCDCDGKCDIRQWCIGISIYGSTMYLLSAILFILMLFLTDRKTFEEYFMQFENSPDVLGDSSAFTFQGFRHTMYTQVTISLVMFLGYVMLFGATQSKSRRSYLLCLGLPIVTPGSIIIQIILYFVFQVEETGTVVNYLLILDMYFGMCAVGLYTTLKSNDSNSITAKESGLIDFPEFPPDRIPNVPLAYLTQHKLENTRRMTVERPETVKDRDEINYIWRMK